MVKEYINPYVDQECVWNGLNEGIKKLKLPENNVLNLVVNKPYGVNDFDHRRTINLANIQAKEIEQKFYTEEIVKFRKKFAINATFHSEVFGKITNFKNLVRYLIINTTKPCYKYQRTYQDYLMQKLNSKPREEVNVLSILIYVLFENIANKSELVEMLVNTDKPFSYFEFRKISLSYVLNVGKERYTTTNIGNSNTIEKTYVQIIDILRQILQRTSTVEEASKYVNDLIDSNKVYRDKDLFNGILMM